MSSTEYIYTIEEVREFVSKGYPSVSGYTISAFHHYNERVKNDGWVSVKDSLPPATDKHYYWLYQEEDNRIRVGEYDYDEKYFVDSAYMKVYGITHYKVPVGPNGNILELKEL